MRYLICYDITENKMRSRVAKILEKIGRRLQYSVFYVDITEKECQGLRQKLIETTEDSEKSLLLIVPLCASCYGRSWIQGTPLEKEESYIVA